MLVGTVVTCMKYYVIFMKTQRAKQDRYGSSNDSFFHNFINVMERHIDELKQV